MSAPMPTTRAVVRRDGPALVRSGLACQRFVCGEPVQKEGLEMRMFRLCAILIVLVGASIVPARSSGAAACRLDCVRINQGCRADGAELWTCSTLDALCFGPTAGAGFRSACTRGGGFVSTSGGGLLCSCQPPDIGID